MTNFIDLKISKLNTKTQKVDTLSCKFNLDKIVCVIPNGEKTVIETERRQYVIEMKYTDLLQILENEQSK